MKKIRLRTLVIYGFAALSGGSLLYTSQQVQIAEEKFRAVQAELEKERESIRVLRAEWDYLNNPERLESLAQKYLDLAPPQPRQILSEPPAIASDPPAGLDPQPVSAAAPPQKDFSEVLEGLKEGGAP